MPDRPGRHTGTVVNQEWSFHKKDMFKRRMLEITRSKKWCNIFYMLITKNFQTIKSNFIQTRRLYRNQTIRQYAVTAHCLIQSANQNIPITGLPIRRAHPVHWFPVQDWVGNHGARHWWFRPVEKVVAATNPSS